MDIAPPVFEWVRFVTEPVLWICQPPRSGGTLLLRLLDSHPQLHNYPSVFGFNNEKMIWPDQDELLCDPEQLLTGLFERMSLEKFDHVGLSKQSSNMIQERYPIYFDKKWFKSIFLKSYSACENGRNEFNALFTAIFNAWRNYQSLYFPKKYIVGHMTMRWSQLPYYAQNFENFQKSYPDGYMIFITREPDDWMASFTKLKVATPYTGDPYDAANYYKQYYQSAISLVGTGKLVIIRFRDLILNYEQTMLKMVSKLNIQWNDLLLYPTFNGDLWYQNSSFNLDRKACIDRSVIGRGKELRGDEAKAVDSEMWSLFEELSRHSINIVNEK
jgi:hypothetical protein